MGSEEVSVTGGGEQVILATAGYDHSIRFWQAHSGKCRRTVQYGESQVNAMEITPDRQLLAAGGFQHLRMYDLNTVNPNPVLNYEGIVKNITSLGFHEDGKWMFTGGEDGSARIWDLRGVRSMQCQRIFQTNSPVNCIAIHSNQAELIIGDQSGIVHIWDLRTNKNEQLIPDPDSSIQHIAINTEGTLAAAVTNRGICYIWSINQGSGDESIQLVPKLKIAAHKRFALKCKFSPDSKYLATTSADTTVKIWNTSNFSPMTELADSNQRWVWDIAFSADSQYIITASSDNMARLWNVEQAKIKREYSGHQKAVTSLAFRDVALSS